MSNSIRHKKSCKPHKYSLFSFLPLISFIPLLFDLTSKLKLNRQFKFWNVLNKGESMLSLFFLTFPPLDANFCFWRLLQWERLYIAAAIGKKRSQGNSERIRHTLKCMAAAPDRRSRCVALAQPLCPAWFHLACFGHACSTAPKQPPQLPHED